eukprot:COSAG01_NODE_3734_length_5750_cov_2.251991_6_plen_58_part_00
MGGLIPALNLSISNFEPLLTAPTSLNMMPSNFYPTMKILTVLYPKMKKRPDIYTHCK